jgi:hypothetical protein
LLLILFCFVWRLYLFLHFELYCFISHSTPLSRGRAAVRVARGLLWRRRQGEPRPVWRQGGHRARLPEVCMLHVACCMLHVACCMLHVACCMLHVACCMLHVACCMLHVVFCILFCFLFCFVLVYFVVVVVLYS